MANLQANGVTIEYEVTGEGQPLLLVMGLAGQLVDWNGDFVAMLVDKGFKVITFDNRDIGLSTQGTWTPPGRTKTLAAVVARRPMNGVDYTLVDMAADAAGLLDGLGIAAAHVMGISMGGMIAQEMGIGHPEKVLSMCSIMSNPGDRRSGGIAPRLMAKVARRKPPTMATVVDESVEMFGLVAGPHYDPDEHRRMVRRSVDRSFTPDGVARQMAAIASSRDRTPLLGSITAPSLVVHGMLDPLVRMSGGVATARAIPNSRLLAFPDMAHDLPRPRWPELVDAIVANCDRAGNPAAVEV